MPKITRAISQLRGNVEADLTWLTTTKKNIEEAAQAIVAARASAEPDARAVAEAKASAENDRASLALASQRVATALSAIEKTQGDVAYRQPKRPPPMQRPL